MATSNDHAGLPFVQAQGYTKGRPDGPPIWVVIHTMEASEYSQRAESTAAYFANPSDGRDVSAHYCADDDSVVQCVDLDDVAWTVGNRPGNYRGINWELSGFANQSRAEWLDPFGMAMLALAAPLMRSDCARFGIPVRRCSIDDLKAMRPGFTTHNDLRVAYNVTTHTDPGPNFPFDYLFTLIGGGDMPSEWHTGEPSGPLLTQGSPGYAGQQRDTALAFAWQASHEAQLAAQLAVTKCDEILALLKGQTPGNVGAHIHEGGATGPVSPAP